MLSFILFAILTVNVSKAAQDCSSYKRCEKCQAIRACKWDINIKSCATVPNFGFIVGAYFKPVCPCTKCLTWYDKEKENTRWLDTVNKEYKCPCRVRIVNRKRFWVSVSSEMKEVDNPSDKKWVPDTACTYPESSGCKKNHPGASGCLRSEGHTADNAAQQCCYGPDGKLLPAGSTGAGTPNKQHSGIWNILNHLNADVYPFDDCCKNCEVVSYCNHYIGEVRKGDDSHCT